jgi:hypothetical protein
MVRFENADDSTYRTLYETLLRKIGIFIQDASAAVKKSMATSILLTKLHVNIHGADISVSLPSTDAFNNMARGKILL